MLLPPKRNNLQSIKESEPKKKSQPEHKKYEPHAELYAEEPHVEHQEKRINKNLENLLTLPDRVKESNSKNELFTEICKYSSNPIDWDRPHVDF